MSELKESAKPLNSRLLESVVDELIVLNDQKQQQIKEQRDFRQSWQSHKEPENTKTNITIWIAILAIVLNATPESPLGKGISFICSLAGLTL